MPALELSPISGLPSAMGHGLFVEAAAAVRGEGACCLFVIDESIPAGARSGYAALVIAYARASEPVTILDDGSAVLLIRSGGVAAARVAAVRLLNQMSRLGLRQTLRGGVAPLTGGADDAIASARAVAAGAPVGEVALAA